MAEGLDCSARRADSNRVAGLSLRFGSGGIAGSSRRRRQCLLLSSPQIVADANVGVTREDSSSRGRVVKNHPPFFSPTREDWIRLAAFIDGEGCIELYAGPPRNKTGVKDYRLCVKVSNTDRRMPDWCHQTFGCGHMETPKSNTRPGRKPLTDWAVDRTAAIPILQGCLKFFVNKREQAEIALRYASTFMKRGTRHRLTPEVISFRNSCIRELWALKKSRKSKGR